MTKLRTLLRYNSTFYILLFITLIYVIITIKIDFKPTKYNLNTNQIKGIIDKIKWDGNHLLLIVRSKEKIIVNYYYDDYDKYINDHNKLKLGYLVNLYGTIKRPMKNTTFNLFNYQNYLLSNKIYWIFDAKEITYQSQNSIFYNFKNKIISYLKGYDNNYPYIKAFILSDSSEIDNNTSNLYRTNGISHLLVTSSLHVALLSSILLFFLKKIFKRTLISYGITIVFLFLYMFLSNSSISIVRATLYFSFMFLNKTFNLQIKPINIIIIILLLILIDNPYSIYNLGLQYTFTISIFLNYYKKKFKRYKNYISKILIISIVSFLSSMPILINNNFSINLLSPIINIIFIPIITLVIIPFSILILIFPGVSFIFNYFMLIIEQSLHFFEYIKIELILAHMPFYIVILYYIFIYYFINGIFSKKIKYLFPLICLIILHTKIAYFNPNSTITMLDVGQGDSLIITLPYNKGNILIDTGGKTNYVNDEWKIKAEYSISESITIPYLKSIGISKIDYLVLTHGDVDHLNESINLINNFNIQNVIFNAGNMNKNEIKIMNKLIDKRINYLNISEYKLTIDKFSFYFINKINTKDENKDSLVIFTTINKHPILLMADAEKENEKYILSKYNIPKIDILKISHHGSKNNTSKEFINYIEPKISLISVGRNNLFNHPHKETLDIFKNKKIYLTSINGSIKIILNKNISVITCLNNKYFSK